MHLMHFIKKNGLVSLVGVNAFNAFNASSASNASNAFQHDIFYTFAL